MKARLNTEPYSPLKPTKGGFTFIEPNSQSRGLGNTARAEAFKSRAQKYYRCCPHN